MRRAAKRPIIIIYCPPPTALSLPHTFALARARPWYLLTTKTEVRARSMHSCMHGFTILREPPQGAGGILPAIWQLGPVLASTLVGFGTGGRNYSRSSYEHIRQYAYCDMHILLASRVCIHIIIQAGIVLESSYQQIHDPTPHPSPPAPRPAPCLCHCVIHCVSRPNRNAPPPPPPINPTTHHHGTHPAPRKPRRRRLQVPAARGPAQEQVLLPRRRRRRRRRRWRWGAEVPRLCRESG